MRCWRREYCFHVCIAFIWYCAGMQQREVTIVSMANRNGLSRYIPACVKRAVRAKCGFGCVVCGSAFYQYEHLENEFHECTQHDPDDIILLCGGCHDRVTRGVLSKSTVKERAQNPQCKTDGYSKARLDYGLSFPVVVIGSLVFENVGRIIRIDGEDILSVYAPGRIGGPYLVNAYVSDKDGNEIFRIVDNEWLTPTTVWDAEVVGKRVTLRYGKGKIAMTMVTEPPNRLIFEAIDMTYRGSRVVYDGGDTVSFIAPDGTAIHGGSSNFVNLAVGVDINNNSVAMGVNRSAYRAGSRYCAIGRNDSCPCGSGVKFKHCHGR